MCSHLPKIVIAGLSQNHDMQAIFQSESFGIRTKEVISSVESRAFFTTTHSRFSCNLQHIIVLDLQNMLNAGKKFLTGR